MNDKHPVLILPGFGNSGTEHWQSCWERQDPFCRRVHQRNWDSPHCSDWILQLDHVVSQIGMSAVIAAHGWACSMVSKWVEVASLEQTRKIVGALLVAPSDTDFSNHPHDPQGFGPVPLGRLPFASIVVASSDDCYVAPDRALRYATAWGSLFVLLKGAGHINASSGFGSWPSGFSLLDTLRVPQLTRVETGIRELASAGL